MSELLTEAEHTVVRLLGNAASRYARHVVGSGPTRDHDIAEFNLAIHTLQNTVLAQAAARAYPELYRLAGDSLR